MIIMTLGAMLALAGLAYLAALGCDFAARNFWACFTQCNNLKHPSRKPFQVFTGAAVVFCFSVLTLAVLYFFKAGIVLVGLIDYFAHA